MHGIVIFLMIFLFIGFAGIVSFIVEQFDRVKFIRRCQRLNFLREHPDYAEDYKGNLIKYK